MMPVNKRAVYWATAFAVAPVILWLCVFFIPALYFSGRTMVVMVSAAPAFFVCAFLDMATGPHAHGPYWPFLVPVPFLNWLFYYYCVFRPLFRWRARRAARQEA
jgi:hypothetical protein